MKYPPRKTKYKTILWCVLILIFVVLVVISARKNSSRGVLEVDFIAAADKIQLTPGTTLGGKLHYAVAIDFDFNPTVSEVNASRYDDSYELRENCVVLLEEQTQTRYEEIGSVYGYSFYLVPKHADPANIVLAYVDENTEEVKASSDVSINQDHLLPEGDGILLLDGETPLEMKTNGQRNGIIAIVVFLVFCVPLAYEIFLSGKTNIHIGNVWQTLCAVVAIPVGMGIAIAFFTGGLFGDSGVQSQWNRHVTLAMRNAIMENNGESILPPPPSISRASTLENCPIVQMGGDSGGVLEEDEYGFFWEYIDMIHNDQNGARESSKAFLQDPLGVERLILVDYEYSYATFERRLVGNKPGTGTKISYLKADAYVQVYDMREGIMTGASKAEIPTGERNTAEQVIVSDENIMTAIRKALNPVQAQ